MNARDGVERLQDFIAERTSLVVLTGAGCSTESGIPDYRSPGGSWTKFKPVMFQDFLRNEAARRHYWARSYHGWDRFSAALPNEGHKAIARWEDSPRFRRLITQNVDRLHSQAGSRRLVELHGSNHEVGCLACRVISSRRAMQERMRAENENWFAGSSALAPDGDASLTREQTEGFNVPPCAQCGGILKPTVVFFGESVERAVVDFCMNEVGQSDGLLVIGSSLTVWSGFRFAKAAVDSGKRLALLNLGPTRADDIASLKVEASCSETLRYLQF